MRNVSTLDHIFLTVSDIDRSIAFYERVPPILEIPNLLDYDGEDGLAGHPYLKGFCTKGRIFFRQRQGTAAPCAVHVGFVADSEQMVSSAYAEALAAGATEIHPPGPQLHYDPRYNAAQVTDLDGYSLEFVYKSWQHGS
ncbi:VOC family protein [Cupriavidus basilensis]|uniref:VOC family protein n=1 Tax=Cupriavidus basilensis TaxID=68895 RepID=UPI0005BD6824|nr:VOC family protein [Cupriavidus basilensis]